MKEILDDVERWRAQGKQVAIATVVATRRSAPRPVGAKLAVSDTGEICGSVSGGCVESDVYENAREVLETGRPKLLSYGIADEDAWENQTAYLWGPEGIVEPFTTTAQVPVSGDATSAFSTVSRELTPRVALLPGEAGSSFHG